MCPCAKMQAIFSETIQDRRQKISTHNARAFELMNSGILDKGGKGKYDEQDKGKGKGGGGKYDDQYKGKGKMDELGKGKGKGCGGKNDEGKGKNDDGMTKLLAMQHLIMNDETRILHRLEKLENQMQLLLELTTSNLQANQNMSMRLPPGLASQPASITKTRSEDADASSDPCSSTSWNKADDVSKTV